MKGIVIKSTGSWHNVLAEEQVYACRIRGKIRLEEIKETNPVTIGDQVEIETEEGAHLITRILPRKNQLLRQSVKKTGHSNVLAANIDQAILIATLQQPRTSLGFIDRFLVSAEAYRIPQVVVFNKMDLFDAVEQQQIMNLIRAYQNIGARVFTTSALKDQGIAELIKILPGKVSLFTGHSGSGKSTLMNKISPQINQSVGPISGSSEKGTHTTTFSEMFSLDKGTFVIDTPGIKEWGLVDMTPQEISDYFPEMRDLRLNCKYGSKCLHLQEPGCAIRSAVEKKNIVISRFESYVSMVEGKDNRK